MRHRKTHRRLFVLQLHDRIEPPKRSKRLKRGILQDDYVLGVLQGHKLKCPQCGNEPRCTRVDVKDDVQIQHSYMGGSAGVSMGHAIVTLEAQCGACNSEITYNIDPDGLPTSMSVVTRFGDP